MTHIAHVPTPDTEFIALARTRKGRLFKKQILPYGSFVHPANPDKRLQVDLSTAQTLINNFKNGVCDIVQVPIVDEMNRHVEDPLRNLGEVVDLTAEDDGVYALIDARRAEYADALGKTLLGASAMMHMDYTDTRTGQKVGPTLLHVAVTNRPYITNLHEFEEIVAASADNSKDEVVFLTPEGDPAMTKPTLDEIKTILRDEHSIDLDALTSGPSQGDLVAAMSNVLASAGVIQTEDAEQVTVQDVAEAVIELSREKTSLESQVATLMEVNEAAAQREAETEVDALVQEGKVLPKQRDTMIRLAREDRETFEALIPDDSVVALSAVGVDTHDVPGNEKLEEDIARLADMANGGV